METFKYLGVTVTNTNDIREEIKLRINMEKCMLLFTWENLIIPPAFQEIEVNSLQITS